MESYIYVVQTDPKWFKRRHYNRSITVYRIKRNVPLLVGRDDVNTASYKGDRATAMNIIANATGKKMADGYKLVEQIRLQEV